MTQTQHEISPLFRTAIKANGIVIWEVHSESGHDYHVTVFEGRVTSCERTDGTPCPAWRYRQACHHATLVMDREAERKVQTPYAEPVPTMQALPTNQKGHLNGSTQGFALLK